MKKFKDFLYDKNDILIAVLILVVAAAIIAWRMDVILQYPKQLIHNDSQIETPTVDPSKTDDAASGDQTDNQTGSGDSTDGATGENTGEDDANSGSQGVETLWAAGALTKDVEVDVTGNTATAAIQCLVDAGLFKDYAEYKQICTQSGLDDEKVKGGTFTFEAFLAGAVLNAVPGIVLQLVLIPAVMVLLDRTKLVRFVHPDPSPELV